MANQINVTNYSLYAIIGAPPAIRVDNFSLYAIVNHNTPPPPPPPPRVQTSIFTGHSNRLSR